MINTHKGLFRYTQLPFGISSVPGIFERVMERLLQGVKGVVVYLDKYLGYWKNGRDASQDNRGSAHTTGASRPEGKTKYMQVHATLGDLPWSCD